MWCWMVSYWCAMHRVGWVVFNALQQRLGRKNPTKKMMVESPAFFRAYDILKADGVDVREKPLRERRAILEDWQARYPHPRIDLSPVIPFGTMAELAAIRGGEMDSPFIEGLMLKRHDSSYVPGRPKGPWFKWKREAQTIDAVLLYAQRGSGKRSSFYSDFTFGLWQGEELLPVAKAYSGYTDEELKKLDKWIRGHTTERFGPVRQVSAELVMELAFDSVHESKRHKSGVAMRFPRIHRIRWDKPAAEADQLATLKRMI